MHKISISVLLIWAVVGVSIATLYPLAESITSLPTGIASEDYQSGTDSGTSQQDDGSANSESEDSPGIFQLSTRQGSSQPGHDSDNSESGVGSESSQPGTVSGNKYLVNNFNLNITSFTAEITNPQDKITGDGFYEIKTNPAANHNNVLQSGTFSHSTGTFTITDALTFTPSGSTKYHILVYTNYPEHDNRVDKDEYEYSP